MRSKIEIISKELIKPISPTPIKDRCLDFSSLDRAQLAYPVPIILYYPIIPQDQQVDVKAVNSSQLLLLKKSLSQVLAHYYPFAGRIKDDYNSIICNDDGVPFSEAFAHSYYLDEILGQPNSNIELFQHFLPLEESSLSPTIPLLVQVTFFECGGMTIGICASHKFTDAATLNTLINSWVVAARHGPEAVFPEFVTTAKFIPQVDFIPLQRKFSELLLPEDAMKRATIDDQIVTKIFVFDAACIEDIKAKSVSDAVPIPTRLEAVSALIWKCALAASKKRASLLFRSVNLRKRLILDPPLLNECMGNAVAMAKAVCNNNMDLPDLVKLQRDGMLEFQDEYEYRIGSENALLEIMNGAIEILTQMRRNDDSENFFFNSWSRFQFYDADFGWGKPSWVSVVQFTTKNCVFFMDTIRSGGGFEVWVSLLKSDMEMFEQQLKLLNGSLELL